MGINCVLDDALDVCVVELCVCAVVLEDTGLGELRDDFDEPEDDLDELEDIGGVVTDVCVTLDDELDEDIGLDDVLDEELLDFDEDVLEIGFVADETDELVDTICENGSHVPSERSG